MALIYIKKRREPIEIANERARGLKEQWMDKNTPKDDIIDLGVWAGCIAEIQSIELTSERRYASDDYYKPPTDQQRKTTTQSLEQLGDWVKRQPWHKEKMTPHYTEACARNHCSCTRPEDWINDPSYEAQNTPTAENL